MTLEKRDGEVGVVERVSWARRVFSCWVFVVVIGSVGMLAVIPVVHAAARLRRPSLWWLVAVYAVVDSAIWVLISVMPRRADGSPAQIGPAIVAVMLMLCMVVAGCVHSGWFRRELLGGVADRYPVVHCALLSVDVEKSGDELRDSEAFVRFRRALFQMLRSAFEDSRIAWASCHRNDSGDGMVVAVPSEFPKSRVIYPLLERLAASLRQHNRFAGVPTRMRIRVAVHAGDVRIDEYGITGRPKVLLARLLDAEPLRRALATSPDSATVAVIVSDSFYEDVICHGHEGIDWPLYKPVTVRVKETEVRAWLHIPGHPLPANVLPDSPSRVI
jgi:class 3 adenylate cyclase